MYSTGSLKVEPNASGENFRKLYKIANVEVKRIKKKRLGREKMNKMEKKKKLKSC